MKYHKKPHYEKGQANVKMTTGVILKEEKLLKDLQKEFIEKGSQLFIVET